MEGSMTDRMSLVLCGLVLAGMACAEAPREGTTDLMGPQLAPFTTVPGEVTLVAGDLVADGKGPYRDGVCGVSARFTSPAEGLFKLAPSASSIPKSQTAACAGIAPRTATLLLHTRHLNDDPHLDDSENPAGSGAFGLLNFQPYQGAGTLINAPPACFIVGKSGRVTGRGLRFDADNYAGSDDLIREDLGDGLWRISSPPGALAWCEDNSGISRWHVNVVLLAQVLQP
jgi:hypothetical protein